ncbi:MAG: hypothetical protein KDA89_09590 [Planctomycetaceae bacterium]|nr:hypothetical protein [Planctomycetaceae bacterium]
MKRCILKIVAIGFALVSGFPAATSVQASTVNVSFEPGAVTFQGDYLSANGVVGCDMVAVENYYGWWKFTAGPNTDFLPPGYSKPIKTMYISPVWHQVGDLTINLPGPGSSVILLDVSIPYNLNVSTGDKSGGIAVIGCDVGDSLHIKAFTDESLFVPGHTEQVTVWDTVVQNDVTIEGAPGDDVIWLGRITADRFEVATNGGHNSIHCTSQIDVTEFMVDAGVAYGAVTEAELRYVKAGKLILDGALTDGGNDDRLYGFGTDADFQHTGFENTYYLPE